MSLTFDWGVNKCAYMFEQNVRQWWVLGIKRVLKRDRVLEANAGALLEWMENTLREFEQISLMWSTSYVTIWGEEFQAEGTVSAHSEMRGCYVCIWKTARCIFRTLWARGKVWNEITQLSRAQSHKIWKAKKRSLESILSVDRKRLVIGGLVIGGFSEGGKQDQIYIWIGHCGCYVGWKCRRYNTRRKISQERIIIVHNSCSGLKQDDVGGDRGQILEIFWR